MTIENQLKQIILEKYKSVRAFTMDNDIPYSTVDSVFKRGISNAGVSTMIKIFGALDLDIESISEGTLHGKIQTKEDSLLNQKEEKLVGMYRGLNQEGQEKLYGYAVDLTRTGDYKKVYSFQLDAKEV